MQTATKFTVEFKHGYLFLNGEKCEFLDKFSRDIYITEDYVIKCNEYNQNEQEWESWDFMNKYYPHFVPDECELVHDKQGESYIVMTRIYGGEWFTSCENMLPEELLADERIRLDDLETRGNVLVVNGNPIIVDLGCCCVMH